MKKMQLLSLIICLLLSSGCSKNQSTFAKRKVQTSELADLNINRSKHEIIKKPINLDEDRLPVVKSEAVEDDYFNDAVFVGDSRVSGLIDYGVLGESTAKVYAAESLDLNKVFLKQVILMDNGSYGTLLDALSQHSFQKVYVSFGLNEMGWRVLSIFEEKYVELVEAIKALQPEATIYLLSVYNYSEDHENEDDFTNLEQVKRINDEVKQVAKLCDVEWINSNDMLGGDDEYLSREWSEDGYHLNTIGYQHWLEMLKEHTLRE